MGRMLSPVLREISAAGSAAGRQLAYWCPGCRCAHIVTVEKPNRCGARWTFDGVADRPTLSPSVNVGPGHCHHFVTEGRIQFCTDSSWHKLGGTIVDLPAWPGGDDYDD